MSSLEAYERKILPKQKGDNCHKDIEAYCLVFIILTLDFPGIFIILIRIDYYMEFYHPDQCIRLIAELHHPLNLSSNYNI